MSLSTNSSRIEVTQVAEVWSSGSAISRPIRWTVKNLWQQWQWRHKMHEMASTINLRSTKLTHLSEQPASRPARSINVNWRT